MNKKPYKTWNTKGIIKSSLYKLKVAMEEFYVNVCIMFYRIFLFFKSHSDSKN